QSLFTINDANSSSKGHTSSCSNDGNQKTNSSDSEDRSAECWAVRAILGRNWDPKWDRSVAPEKNFNQRQHLTLRAGGGSGIRTHVTVSRKHAFQACAFSHSATPPDRPL